jgi:signal transduction histidine kinase
MGGYSPGRIEVPARAPMPAPRLPHTVSVVGRRQHQWHPSYGQYRPHGWQARNRHGRPLAKVPVALAAIQIIGTRLGAAEQPDALPLDALAYALLVAGPLALLGRRRYPVPVAVATVAITLGYLALGYPPGPVVLSPAVALFSAAAAGHRYPAWITAGLGYAGYVLIGAQQGLDLSSAVGTAAWLSLVLVVGEVARGRREWIEAAGHARAEASRRQVSDERLEIARELHDVIAHNISLINVQAGVALHLMDEQPAQARTALTTIKQASKETLQELRATLGVLRRVDEDAPRAPTPGLNSLDALVERVGTAGVAATVEVDGDRRPLPAAVDLAAYRIVQEALTNVYRHSGASAATVRIDYGEREVTVQVDDDGRGAPLGDDDGGNGIRGMQERATALGGTLTAGPRQEGGFRVAARLPLDGTT